MDGWNTTFLLGSRPIFRGEPLVSGRVCWMILQPSRKDQNHHNWALETHHYWSITHHPGKLTFGTLEPPKDGGSVQMIFFETSWWIFRFHVNFQGRNHFSWANLSSPLLFRSRHIQKWDPSEHFSSYPWKHFQACTWPKNNGWFTWKSPRNGKENHMNLDFGVQNVKFRGQYYIPHNHLKQQTLCISASRNIFV